MKIENDFKNEKRTTITCSTLTYTQIEIQLKKNL